MTVVVRREAGVPAAPAPGRVDLWLVPRPVSLGADELAWGELDAGERARAGAFVRPGDRLLYTAAHVALRRLLGGYTATRPEKVRLRREPCPGCGRPHGRPVLAPPAPPLHFSLSHSGDLALVGVAARPLGVDVQRLPGAEAVALCLPALHPDERAELLAVPAGAARQALFGRIWTRKEAYLKGLGTGLHRPAGADYLGADPARHPAGWTVLGIPCGPGHAASAAVHGTPPAVAEVRQWPESWLRAGAPVHPPTTSQQKGGTHVRSTGHDRDRGHLPPSRRRAARDAADGPRG
ncbi:4'-phosphopantetheinyl transferase superfamily protein [Streptomyces sp. NPDC049590]|uniref:4'-phosphopantetheinyl transferase family protein n=1 Tax=Streptomyces sp. NPDC049590 TaxID=3154834 RepID=UPI0034178105